MKKCRKIRAYKNCAVVPHGPAMTRPDVWAVTHMGAGHFFEERTQGDCVESGPGIHVRLQVFFFFFFF